MTIGKKMYIYFGCCGLIPFIVMAIVAYNSASTSLKDQAFNQLMSVREMKKSQIEDYFSTIRKQIRTFSEDRMIIMAMKYFKGTFLDFRMENDMSDSQLEKYRNDLRAYYTEDFTQEYKNQNNGQNPDATGFLNQLDDDSVALQYFYIKANNNGLGEKHKLDFAKDESSYSNLHAKYHPIIRNYLEQFGYYDIFLVDPDSGDIVYSVFKELDFATSLKDGPYAKTNFGRVFNDANNSNDPNYVKLVDFEPYTPSYKGAASFMASPIFDGPKKVGVLLFQMPVDKINLAMTNNNDWKSAGLGESGETYVIGDDYSMRSQSRFLIEDKEGYYALMDSLGMDQGTLNEIKAKESTIGLQKVETKGTRAAISGVTNAEIYPDYRNIPVLSAYAPLKIQDVKWSIISEIDEAEAFASVYSLRNWSLIIGGIIAAIVAAVVFMVTSQITKLLKGVIINLSQSSDQVASATGQISASSQGLAQGASEQASSIEETSASMEEMASVTKQNSNNAGEAAKLVDLCSVAAEKGNGAVAEMNTSMGAINQSSKKIAEITKVIDGIAFQTNLLALNAAVEAARAGEHGKGFAVVAEEVRNLAQRSSTAAKDTADLINDCVTNADEGTRVSGKCKESLEEIVKNVKKVTDLTKEIANASAEQTVGIDQVAQSVQQMDQITQQNAASAEETASASEELTAQAQSMKEQVDVLSAQIGGKVEDVSKKSHVQPVGNSHNVILKKTLGDSVKRARGVTSLASGISNESSRQHPGRAGNGRKVASHVEAEALIPMGEEKIVEHDGSHKDF